MSGVLAVQEPEDFEMTNKVAKFGLFGVRIDFKFTNALNERTHKLLATGNLTKIVIEGLQEGVHYNSTITFINNSTVSFTIQPLVSFTLKKGSLEITDARRVHDIECVLLKSRDQTDVKFEIGPCLLELSDSEYKMTEKINSAADLVYNLPPQAEQTMDVIRSSQVTFYIVNNQAVALILLLSCQLPIISYEILRVSNCFVFDKIPMQNQYPRYTPTLFGKNISAECPGPQPPPLFSRLNLFSNFIVNS